MKNDNGTEIKDQPTFRQIRYILDEIKNQHYTNPDNATDAQAFGILMAKWFRWDGVQILEATYAGLEDSNFHTENRKIEEMLKRLNVEDGLNEAGKFYLNQTEE